MMDRAWSFPPLLFPCPLSTVEISGEERREEKLEKRGGAAVEVEQSEKRSGERREAVE